MKKLLGSLIALGVSVFSISSELQADEFSHCSQNDAVCVGRVLSQQLGGGGGSSNRGVSFYSSGSCDSNSLLIRGRMRSGENIDQACRRLAEGIFKNVDSVKVDDACMDVHGMMTFEFACKKYLE